MAWPNFGWAFRTTLLTHMFKPSALEGFFYGRSEGKLQP